MTWTSRLSGRTERDEAKRGHRLGECSNEETRPGGRREIHTGKKSEDFLTPKMSMVSASICMGAALMDIRHLGDMNDGQTDGQIPR